METTYAYLAGLIDGEGCISIRKCKQYGNLYYKPMIEVGMVDKKPIELLEKTFGNSAWYQIMPIGKRKLVCHKWRVTGTNCLPVITAILPYLVVKKEQALIVLDLIKRIYPRGRHFSTEERNLENSNRDILYNRMFNLNHPVFDSSVLPK